MEGIGLGSKGCVSLIAPNYPPSGPLSGYPSSTQAEGLDPVQSIINGEVDTHGSTEGRTGQVEGSWNEDGLPWWGMFGLVGGSGPVESLRP